MIEAQFSDIVIDRHITPMSIIGIIIWGIETPRGSIKNPKRTDLIAILHNELVIITPPTHFLTFFVTIFNHMLHCLYSLSLALLWEEVQLFREVPSCLVIFRLYII